jgi:hypothetical protein
VSDDKKPIDPQAAVTFMLTQAPKYAKAKAERVYLDEYRKSLKAILMQRCNEQSIGAQERDAYAHPEYTAHLKALEAAVEAEETLRWQMVAAQTRVEVWRSQEASNRAMDRATA